MDSEGEPEEGRQRGETEEGKLRGETEGRNRVREAERGGGSAEGKERENEWKKERGKQMRGATGHAE